MFRTAFSHVNHLPLLTDRFLITIIGSVGVFWQSPATLFPLFTYQIICTLSHTTGSPSLSPACLSSGWGSDLPAGSPPTVFLSINLSKVQVVVLLLTLAVPLSYLSILILDWLVRTSPWACGNLMFLTSVHCSRLFSQHPSSYSEFQRTRVVKLLE